MKVLKYIIVLTITLASVVGAFVWLGMASGARFNTEPTWIRGVLVVCLIVCPVAALFSFIYSYYRVEKARKKMGQNAEDAKNTKIS